MLLTLGIREVLPATPRARLVRIELGGRAFDYAAGQAVLVGSEGSPKRPYSVAASPDETKRLGYLELLVGVDAEGLPGPHLMLEPGRAVEVEGPLGSFTFPSVPAERRFLFIAGGTGIAPLRAMLHQALARPYDSIGLFYSVRTPNEFAFEDELHALARDSRIDLRQTVTRPVGEDAWKGPRGRIGRTELSPLLHSPETLCFVCGPPAFVAEMTALLHELGVAPIRIRIEQWS